MSRLTTKQRASRRRHQVGRKVRFLVEDTGSAYRLAEFRRRVDADRFFDHVPLPCGQFRTFYEFHGGSYYPYKSETGED